MISLSLDIEDIGEGVNKKKLRPHRELELSCTWSRQTAAVGIILPSILTLGVIIPGMSLLTLMLGIIKQSIKMLGSIMPTAAI